MNQLKRLNEVMFYIEENLDGTIDLKKAAEITLSSEFQFQRIFSFLAGMPLSEYIRKRRLTKAATALQSEEVKVIDVALRYGYASPDAFSRAFEKFHGVLPSEVKQKPHTVKAFPMLTFRLTIQGGKEMNVRMETKGAFQVVGLISELLVENGETDYSVALKDFTEERAEAFRKLSNTSPRGVIHATFEGEGLSDGRVKHIIGAAVSGTYTGDFEKADVPALNWAVFEIEGEWETLNEEWLRIYSEWLPSSDYELVSGPTILASQDEWTEIWIPVKGKE